MEEFEEAKKDLTSLEEAFTIRSQRWSDVINTVTRHTWQSSQRSRWRWPSRHTGDTTLIPCDLSVSSDTPETAYPRSIGTEKETGAGRGDRIRGDVSVKSHSGVSASFHRCRSEPFSSRLRVSQPPAAQWEDSFTLPFLFIVSILLFRGRLISWAHSSFAAEPFLSCKSLVFCLSVCRTEPERKMKLKNTQTTRTFLGKLAGTSQLAVAYAH